MNREPNNRSIKNIPDLFDEALELEETIVQPSPEEADLPGEMTAETAGITADPTFFDEQVINVPIIDPPDMKSISSYPDTQIYDHLFSTDDDFLLDEETVEEDDDFLLDAEAVEDVISSMKETPADSETIELETTEPEPIIDEVVPIFPDLEPAPAVKEPERFVAAVNSTFVRLLPTGKSGFDFSVNSKAVIRGLNGRETLAAWDGVTFAAAYMYA